MKTKAASTTTNDTLVDDEKLARELQHAMDMEESRNGNHDEQTNKKPHQQQQNQLRKKRRKPKPNMEELQENGICTIEQMRGTVDHMLYVLCEIDGYPAEMLIDSGASTSAISSMMMKKLNLETKLSPQIAGNASGVGMTKILGAIENVTCSVGQGLFEFRLFFMVLDAPTIPILILGLDQMRRFKCIVDLDDNVLRFGGNKDGGVGVPFLSKELASQAAMTSSMVQQHNDQQQEQQQQQAAAMMLQQQQQAAMLQQQAAMFQQYARRQQQQQQQRRQPSNGNRGQGPPPPPRQRQHQQQHHRRRGQQNPQAPQRQGQQHQSPQRRRHHPPPQQQQQQQQHPAVVRGTHVASSPQHSPSSVATSDRSSPSAGSLMMMKRFQNMFGTTKRK